jgi:hypothetical protein
MVPSVLAAEGVSRAERRLFERLRDETSDELVAFHSVAWLVPGANGRAPRQGESDFVLAHPDRGVITVEVKGGSVSFDAATGQWRTQGREGEFVIRDPVRQAQRNSHLLRASLARARRDIDERIGFGYAVAFPDTRNTARRLRPDVPREIVIDHRDLDGLEEKVERIFAYWSDREKHAPLGATGLAALKSVLANSFVLKAPLAFELEEEERELLELTEQQYMILDALARHTRVAIAGCAGSGKTFLAAEKARRLAAQGFDVLLVCFNLLLARHLGHGLADVDGIDVFAYDDLCRHIAREAGREFAEEPTPGAEGKYYAQLRNAFAESVDVAAGRYGALIVDEAQDIHPDWWIPLQLLLQDPDRSPLYVFYDDNQRIFPVPEGLPISDPPVHLTINCRNTQRINEIVRAYYGGETIVARGPQGLPVDLHLYDNEDELVRELDAGVRALLEQAEVPPHEIVLLTPRSSARSVLWQVEKLGGVRLTDDPWEKGRILRSSIYRFKGLERLVVAVAELDGARDDAFYVGFSRASTFLSIYCSKSARRRLPRELVRPT